MAPVFPLKKHSVYTENGLNFKHSISALVHILPYLVLFFSLSSCGLSRNYRTVKIDSFTKAYYFKQKRADGLSALVHVAGIPHYHFYKIYADEQGRVSRIIWEYDETSFSEAVIQTDSLSSERLLVVKAHYIEALDAVFRKAPFYNEGKRIFTIRDIHGWKSIPKPEDAITLNRFYHLLNAD